MSDRGHALLRVAAGLPEVLSCPAVGDYAQTVWIDDRPPLAAGGLHDGPLAAAAAGADAGDIELAGIAWSIDTDLIAAAPAAVWTLTMSADTAVPGLWQGYSPATGLAEAVDAGDGPAVPLAWALPGATGEYAAAMQRVIGVVAAFDAAAARTGTTGVLAPDDPLLPDPCGPGPAPASRGAR